MLGIGLAAHDARGERSEHELRSQDAREDRQDGRLLGHALEHAALVDEVPDLVLTSEDLWRERFPAFQLFDRGELDQPLLRLDDRLAVEQPLEDDVASAFGQLADDCVGIVHGAHARAVSSTWG